VKSFSNSKFTLAPSNKPSVTFEVIVSDSGITSITGTITFQTGASITGPGLTTPTGGNQPDFNGPRLGMDGVFTPKTTFDINEEIWVKIQGDDPDMVGTEGFLL
jgi:hypothetical protein